MSSPGIFSRHAAFYLAMIVFALTSHARAQPSPTAPSPTSHPALAKTAANPTAAQTAAALDRITRENAELLDLLKNQQAVLEDIQFDRRLQNRQIASLEERLEDAMTENSHLEAQVAKLEEQISLGATAASSTGDAATKTPPPVGKLVDAPPPPPSTYLPPPESEGAPGTKSWHRLFTLSGDNGKTTGLFHIQGVQWRVQWHNQDQPGASYVNTSALFINAFPRDDTIPQKVCSKLGSGGDATELNGPGNYYLKVEASGGHWELAVEDFR